MKPTFTAFIVSMTSQVFKQLGINSVPYYRLTCKQNARCPYRAAYRPLAELRHTYLQLPTSTV